MKWPKTLNHRLAYGGDYNPEQWPESVWADDIHLMAEAGVTFVSLGIFSWSLLEPEEGVYDFAWLDRIMEMLGDADIAVDLATATASVPAWMSRRHPEILPVLADGSTLSPGSRQTWCPSAPLVRAKAVALTTALAQRYADHPALTMWHASNELGCHNAVCHCDVSAAAFRGWLADRYGDVATLNEAWGTTVWSQRYGEFEEILPPRQTPTFPNPGQRMDYWRFTSDELLAGFIAERDVLHRLSPGIPVTTNFMVSRFIDTLDYWRWADEVDIVSNDHYRDGADRNAHVELALAADITRGLAGGRPWFLMEHSTSAVSWQPVNIRKPTGMMTRDSLTHVARGADAVGFFQWRAAHVGAERFHSTMLPHAGTDSERWREVVSLGQVLTDLGPLQGTVVHADVALVYDWQSRWALQQPGLPSTAVTYLDRVEAIYRALYDVGVTVDVVAPGASLDGYSAVFAPTLYMADQATVDSFSHFVEDGGQLLVTYFSGIADESDRLWPGAFPGALRDLLGLRIEEFAPLLPTEHLVLEDGQVVDCWSETIVLDTAVAVSAYGPGPLSGRPAITRNNRGEGTATYVSTRTVPEHTAALVAEVLARAGVDTTDLPEGVDLVRRRDPETGQQYAIVINHSPVDVPMTLAGNVMVGSPRSPGGDLVVMAEGVAVVSQGT